EEIREAVEYPLTRREKYEDLGIQSPRGVLLYGPPGTGKTLLAKAVANESGANFIAIRGPQLLSKWVGESERAVREIFKKARQVSPAIIFFDELDALTPVRGTAGDSHTMESVLNQFLTEMDGLVDLKDVVVMGATNRPDIVDPALLRSGRFDRLIYIGEPGSSDRVDVLKIHSRLIPIEGSVLESLVDATRNFNEDDFEILAQSLSSGENSSGPELMQHIKSVTPSLGTISRAGRRRMLVEIFEKSRINIEDPVLDKLFTDISAKTDGYVGADLEGLCREAAIFAMRDQLNSVNNDHFEHALNKVHPTMNQRLREAYDRVKTHFKGGMQKKSEPPEYQ
ncbi:MAG: AAA family ATPase, partial [Methanospirillum sp.]|nr:AAA family ATPase [Methanospirillum sp.]